MDSGNCLTNPSPHWHWLSGLSPVFLTSTTYRHVDMQQNLNEPEGVDNPLNAEGSPPRGSLGILKLFVT